VLYDEFAEIALGYLNQVCAAARRLTREPADADDLVQETYHLAFEHYGELRNLAHCRAWLYRILHHRAASRLRRRRCAPQLLSIDGENGDESLPPAHFDAELIERIALREIRSIIDALPVELRTAVTLCDVDGFSYAEIAEILECPLGTVRSRIARARAKLMVKLQAHAEECGIRRMSA